MVLKLLRLVATLSIALLVTMSWPVAAHEHNNLKAEQAEAAHRHANVPVEAAEAAEHHHGGEMDEPRPTSFSGRLLAWLGNMHPFAVHFPIALIPASWLALLIARRRGHAVDAIRAVIILAALSAILAAALGWLTGGFALADADPIKSVHRWVGTLLAAIVVAIGVRAWRNPEFVNTRTMVWTLGGTTMLLLVQGWLGAALTHGIDHMMF
jgi:uncharacterized membrane protein